MEDAWEFGTNHTVATGNQEPPVYEKDTGVIRALWNSRVAKFGIIVGLAFVGGAVQEGIHQNQTASSAYDTEVLGPLYADASCAQGYQDFTVQNPGGAFEPSADCTVYFNRDSNILDPTIRISGGRKGPLLKAPEAMLSDANAAILVASNDKTSEVLTRSTMESAKKGALYAAVAGLVTLATYGVLDEIRNRRNGTQSRLQRFGERFDRRHQFQGGGGEPEF